MENEGMRTRVSFGPEVKIGDTITVEVDVVKKEVIFYKNQVRVKHRIQRVTLAIFELCVFFFIWDNHFWFLSSLLMFRIRGDEIFAWIWKPENT